MTKEEMAQQFAEQKTEEVKEMLKAAFLKGYDQGALQTACSISIEGVKYYDMGLPSGTLWSEPIRSSSRCNGMWFYGDYIKISHKEALKYEGLATPEQWEELKDFCKVSHYEVIGRTGERLKLDVEGEGFDYYHRETRAFWLALDVEETNFDGHYATGECFHFNLANGSHFAGYKLPILLTKKKEDIIEG